MNDKFTRFIPIEKVDEDQHMVYGWASTPDLDSDGEVIDLNGLRKALPEYMQFPTIREMHQPKAAGTTLTAEIIDNDVKGKGMWIAAKVVAEDAWKLVKEGVYKGFSVGGRIISKVDNVIKELSLVEISLVDVPANKHAVIEVWKADKQSLKEKIAKVLLYTIAVEGKEVINVEKDKKAKKTEEVVEDQPKTDEVKVDDKSEEKTGESVEGDTPTEETPADPVVETPEGEAKDEDKGDEPESETETPQTEEKSDVELTLEKANKTLDGLTVEKKEELSLAKSVNAMASSVAKMASILEGYDKRIKVLENTPAESKSKAVFVHKSEETEPKEEVKSDRKAEIQKRLGELTALREKLNPNEFARQGYSIEAGKLQDELGKLA